jgi:1-phosphatidylinositol-4-phosphate 5-kinase
MHRTSTTNSVIQRNENDAMNGERSGEHESDRPEPRMISTVRSPSAERSNGLQGQVLPVVEEMGEASSTGGRSAASREQAQKEDEDRPPTPAKDRPLTPPKDYASDRHSLRRPVSRASLQKELPPLPKVSTSVQMSEKHSVLS